MNVFNVGQHIGGYIVTERILPGGAFSETWKCKNPITGRIAVLKGLKPELIDGSDPVLSQLDLITRTKEEAKILSALFDKSYDFVPNVYDVFEAHDGRVFFLSEFIDGRDLTSVINDPAVSQRTRARLAFLLLQGLETIHANGIVHRDVSPDNLMVRQDNSLVILDFGLAKIKTEVLVRKYSPQTVTPISKVKYMPPRVLAEWKPGKALSSDESWDLYAAGVVLFELFSGRILPGPTAQIPQDELARLPISGTIQSLLEHASTSAAQTASRAKFELFRELERAELEGEIVAADEKGALAIAREQIRQLRSDLARGRTPVAFEDFVGYVTRLGIEFTVNPKDKYIKVESSSSAGDVTIVVDVKDRYVMFVMPKLREIQKGEREALEAINTINSLTTVGRTFYNAEFSELRFENTARYSEGGYFSYDDFQREFFLAFRAGVEAAKDFDEMSGKSLHAQDEIPPSAPPVL